MRQAGHRSFRALGCAKILNFFLRQFYVKTFKIRDIGNGVSKRQKGVFLFLPFVPLTFQNRSGFFRPFAGIYALCGPISYTFEK